MLIPKIASGKPSPASAKFSRRRCSVAQKKQMLLGHKIALWDVIQSCDIEGSSDNRIGNVTPADLPRLLANASIKHIFTNGRKARSLYDKYFAKKISINVTTLPSTSPANATYDLEKLILCWRVMERFLN
jgi:hypoxanthine-DNA glycosylase